MIDVSKLNYKIEIGTFHFDFQYIINKGIPYAKIIVFEKNLEEFQLETEFAYLLTMNFLKFDESIEQLVYFDQDKKSSFSNLNLNFDLQFDFSGIKFELTKKNSSFFLTLNNIKEKTLSTVFYLRDISGIMNLVAKYNANLCAIYIEYNLQKEFNDKFGKYEFGRNVWKIQHSKYKIPIISPSVYKYVQQFEEYKKEFDLKNEKNLKERYLKKIFPDIEGRN